MFIGLFNSLLSGDEWGEYKNVYLEYINAQIQENVGLPSGDLQVQQTHMKIW